MFYDVVRSWTWYLSPSLVPEPGRFESSGKVSGVGWASFCCLWSCVSTVWTSSPVGYGRTERIIFAHIQKLFNITIPSKCSISVLWKLNDDLQAHTRSLDAPGNDGDKYGGILTPLILSRLPQDIRLEWSMEGKGHESDLAFLLEFLQSEIQRRERSYVFKESIASPRHRSQGKREMLRLQRLLRYRHLQWLKHVKRPNLFLVAFAVSLIPLIVVLNCCMCQWVLGKRNDDQQDFVFAV